ncbi:MAG: site-2 protease family protein [Acidimicrobiia bacterium]
MSTGFEQALIYFGCLVVAVILHEVSHGVAAALFGDRTAAEAGRLTLNPVPHIDPFGSLILPALGAIAGLPVLGWAKPVPVNPSRMRHPRRDSLYVSLAGPATNFLLMVVAALGARALYQSTTGSYRYVEDLPLAIRILFSFATVNLFLGLFNFLPIPPLDGSALIERVLPEHWLPGWYRFRPYGFLVLFLLVFATGFVGRILDPFYNQLFDFVFL